MECCTVIGAEAAIFQVTKMEVPGEIEGPLRCIPSSLLITKRKILFKPSPLEFPIYTTEHRPSKEGHFSPSQPSADTVWGGQQTITETLTCSKVATGVSCPGSWRLRPQDNMRGHWSLHQEKEVKPPEQIFSKNSKGTGS